MNTGYKTIAVHVNDSLSGLARTRLAARLACRHGTHLVGVAATGLPSALYMGGLTGEAAAIVPSCMDMLANQAGRALAAFEDIARNAGVELREQHIIEEESGVAMCLQARYCDLVVVGQDNPNEVGGPGSPPMVAEYVLLHSVNPVLIVPFAGEFETVGRRAFVAWDGSFAAARTVHGAIPMLKGADLVQIAVFNAEAGAGVHGEEAGADIAWYLSRHGVKVEVARFGAPSGGDDIGRAILAKAQAFGADLLVMGGYGHAHFREVVLGGATRTILRGMTVPVLSAH